MDPIRTARSPALLRALVMLTLLADIGGPRAGVSQQPAEPPYRIVRPEGSGPHPAVLFVSGCSGFAPAPAPHHYGRLAQEFVAQGFVVVFVDYLGARGRSVCGGMVRPNDIVPDILAAAAYARTRPFIRASEISVVGWSMGGGGAMAAIAALPADAPPPFRSAIAYYPECYGVGSPWQAKIPLLMLLGGLDNVSPARVCQELVARLPRDLPIEVRVYPDALHAFDVPELSPVLPGPRRGTLGYHAGAAAEAKAEVKRFLAR